MTLAKENSGVIDVTGETVGGFEFLQQIINFGKGTAEIQLSICNTLIDASDKYPVERIINLRIIRQ